jgi:SAM-dependent methyltransferase
VGPEGQAVGVDAAARFVEASIAEAAANAVGNAAFVCADVESALPFEEPFDRAFSRFGTMFFSNPVAALRNVRAVLVPGAELTMVVWRRREDNEWVFRAQQIVERFVTKPEEYDDPTCGPGPFSMSGADSTSDILLAAGYTDVELARCDLPITIGRDVDEAIELVTALGPAGEILRLAGARAEHLHADIHAALREGLGEYAGPSGVKAPSSTWIVSARAAG